MPRSLREQWGQGMRTSLSSHTTLTSYHVLVAQPLQYYMSMYLGGYDVVAAVRTPYPIPHAHVVCRDG